MTKKQKINIAILIAWIMALGITVAIPADWYGAAVFHMTAGHYGTHIASWQGYPTVSYTADVRLSATGVISVNNPVHVKVDIVQANITDLTKYYPYVRLTGDSYPDGGIPKLKPNGNGGYTAEGDARFFEAGKTWVLLEPPLHTGAETEEDVKLWKSSEPITEVYDVSNTLQVIWNANTVKVGFILGSFSILIVAPVIEGILLKDHKSQS